METLKRKITFEIYLIAAVLTLLLFIAGLMLGAYILSKKTESLGLSQQAISSFLKSLDLKEQSFKGINYCNLSWSDIWEEKVQVGGILAALELRLGKTNSKILEQKKIYNEVQFKTLERVNKVNNECNYSWKVILFFYTNKKGDEKGDSLLSELQGYALDGLYNQNREEIKIFSFDINAKTNATEILTARYNITFVPSLVINETVYRRFVSRNEVAQIIGK